MEHGRIAQPDDELSEDRHGEEALSGEPEAWESWETGLVVGSVAIGTAGLFVLGWLIDRFILP